MFNGERRVYMYYKELTCIKDATIPNDDDKKKSQLWRPYQILYIVHWNDVGKGMTKACWPPRLKGLYFDESKFVELFIGDHEALKVYYYVQMKYVFETEVEALKCLAGKIRQNYE